MPHGQHDAIAFVIAKAVIAWMRENNRATRAARTFWNLRAVIYKATTWNNYILALDDNLSLQ